MNVSYNSAFAFQLLAVLGVVVQVWREALRYPHWFNFVMALAATVLFGFVEHSLIKKSD